LRLHPEKTKIVYLAKGAEGFTFEAGDPVAAGESVFGDLLRVQYRTSRTSTRESIRGLIATEAAPSH